MAVGLDNEPAAHTSVILFVFEIYAHTGRSSFHELPPPTRSDVRAVLEVTFMQLRNIGNQTKYDDKKGTTVVKTV